MTPPEVLVMIRNEAVEQSAAFWNDLEIYDYMWKGEIIIAQKTGCTRTTDTSTTTVASTREYSIPTGVMTTERLTWNSMRLKKIDINDLDDKEGLSYGSTGVTGQPDSYYEYGSVFGLSPIPNAAQTVKIYYIKRPTELTKDSTSFTVPAEYGMNLSEYCLYKMFLKDQELKTYAIEHLRKWERSLVEMEEDYKNRLYRDMDNLVKIKDE